MSSSLLRLLRRGSSLSTPAFVSPTSHGALVSSTTARAATASLGDGRLSALKTGASPRYSTSSSGGNIGEAHGRFNDELEALIARAGAKAGDPGRNSAGKSKLGSASKEDGDRVQGEGGGGGEAAASVMSVRAMKFKAMIRKFSPEKKVVAVKEFSPSREPLIDNLGRAYGLGRRKTSTARVWISLSEGEGGVFMVNSKPMIDYFPRDHLQNEILKPLEITGKLGGFHIRCTAEGGGQAGQAGAIRLGLSRALEAYDPWLRKSLKKAGMMTRDSRMVERKKPGLKKARKAPQWVKR